MAEFLASLDAVDGLDVRLTLSGHGRPFTDLHGHVEGNRALLRERLGAVREALRARGEATAAELLPAVYGEKLMPETAGWLLTKMQCYLEHLERTGRVGGLERRAGALGRRLDLPACGSTSGSPRATEPSFSFEFFPPRTDEGERNLGRALAELSRLSPTFVSVTYGAGGSTTEKRKTIDIVRHLKRDYGMEAMAHFTCVGATTAELREMLDTMRDAGIENVLALRGDPPPGQGEWTATEGGLQLLARADRADPRRVRRSRSARRASRRSTSTRPTPRATCAT